MWRYFPYVLLLLAVSCSKPKNSFLLGGIQVNEANQDEWTTTLRKSGFNTVEVTTYAMQGDWDSWNMWWYKKDTSILREVRAAKRQGLNVVLVLRVALDHSFKRNKFLWHGLIMPKNRAFLDEWFKRYRAFSSFWAEIAEREGIDLLVMGSEMKMLTWTNIGEEIPDLPAYYYHEEKQQKLIDDILEYESVIDERHLWVRGDSSYSSLQQHLEDRRDTWRSWAVQMSADLNLDSMKLRAGYLDSQWKQVAKTIRQSFKGDVSYAANFDNYQHVGFWDELDVMGINAYFTLRDYLNDSISIDSQLVGNWRRHLEGIDTFRLKVNPQMPVVFTELGYTNLKNSTVHPWASAGFEILESDTQKQLLVWKDFEPLPSERAFAVKSLLQVVHEQKFPLKGILYWKLTTHDYLLKEEPFGLLLVGNDPLEGELRKFSELDYWMIKKQ